MPGMWAMSNMIPGERVAGAITPVPAGVGPVTIATLLKHTVEAAERSVIEIFKL